MLYRNILKHEAGFDYEFEEGVLANITHMSVGDDGELDFEIDGEIACATVEEFKASWAPVLDNDSVKNLQKEWAKRIEEDKRFFTETVYNVLNTLNNFTYPAFEDLYTNKFRYNVHATCKLIRDNIKEMKANNANGHIVAIFKDFAELWIAQHM